jgi:Leucine-rich repeat (LRR) protein
VSPCFQVGDNQLTSLPAEIGQLTRLKWLHVNNNQLKWVPAELGQLPNLEELWVRWPVSFAVVPDLQGSG